MKKTFILIITILLVAAFCIPTFAENSGSRNSIVTYMQQDAYANAQAAMIAFRPRFAGTIVANTTIKVDYNNDSYYAMNYFPLPTNWYNYNGGVYISENSFSCIPIDIDTTDYVQKYILFNESPSTDTISMQLGTGAGGVMGSAPDLYFDGVLGLYDTGYSFQITNLGEVNIALSFTGKLYYSDGSNLITTTYNEQFVVDMEEQPIFTLDELVRSRVNDTALSNADAFFVGTFCIIANNPSDVDEGLEFTYKMNMLGDPKSIVYNGTTIAQNSGDQSEYVLDKYTKLLTSHSSSSAPTPSYPAYNSTVTANGTHRWTGTYTNGSILVNVPTYQKDSRLNITQNGSYNVGAYNYVSVNVPQDNITIEDTNMFSWLISVASGFLAFEIAPDFTIGGILILCVGFALIMWLIKVFLGG